MRSRQREIRIGEQPIMAGFESEKRKKQLEFMRSSTVSREVGGRRQLIMLQKAISKYVSSSILMAGLVRRT